MDAVTRVIGPGERCGRRSSRDRARAAAPAGLWAPSRSTSRSPTRSSSSRPGQTAAGVAAPPGVGRDGRDPRGLQCVERRVGDRGIGRLVPSAQPDPGRTETGQVHLDPVAVPAQERGRSGLGQRHAHPARAPADDRQPVTVGTGHGQVAALDDGRLLPGDLRDRVAEPVHVVEVDVGHDRHAAVPDVGRIEPAAETDLDQRDVRTDLGEAREDDGGQQLELGRVAVPAGDPVRDGQHPPDEPGEVVRGDRLPVDLDPLAVRDEVRLRGGPDPMTGRPERRLGQGEDAALAVRPGDERAADGALRMIELAQQGPRPAEPEPDAEAAALRQRAQGLLVGQTGGRLGHRGPITRGSARPRRRRTG